MRPTLKLVLFAVATSAACRGQANPTRGTEVTVRNRTSEVLTRVEVILLDMRGNGASSTTLGSLAQGESRVIRLDLDRPRQLVVSARSGPCGAHLEGPWLVSGTDYVGVIESRSVSQSITTDIECYTEFTLRGSVRIRGAA